MRAYEDNFCFRGITSNKNRTVDLTVKTWQTGSSFSQLQSLHYDKLG